MKQLKLYAISSILTITFFQCSTPASTPESPLEGIWTNQATGGNQTFIFKKDKQALWIFNKAGGKDTFAIQYLFDDSTTPAKLDLIGFSEGPFVGQSLFGIMAFEGDQVFKFNCIAAEPNEPGDALRPNSFDPQQTRHYQKVQ